MRWDVDYPRGHRRSRRDPQDSHAPRLTKPCPTTSSGPPRGLAADSLISPTDSGLCQNRQASCARFPPYTPGESHRFAIIPGKRASQPLLAGYTPAWQTTMFGNCPRKGVFGSFLFIQKGLLKFLFPMLEVVCLLLQFFGETILKTCQSLV